MLELMEIVASGCLPAPQTHIWGDKGLASRAPNTAACFKKAPGPEPGKRRFQEPWKEEEG